jgi:glycerate kinase
MSLTDSPMRVLIAPNAFKHAIDAAAAAAAIEEGLSNSRLNCHCERFPIGDGGDGTCDLIVQRRGGIRVPVAVHDALGRKLNASFGLIDDGATAVIEMADASGIRLLQSQELDPLRTTSYGTGELIGAALDKGVKKIIIGMGGSATVDGGSGILEALGIRFLDADGSVLSSAGISAGAAAISLPESLVDLASIDLSGLDSRVGSCEFVVLCDVDNFLLGPLGSAAVFGPQKGATPKTLPRLEAALTRFSEVTLQQTGMDMSQLRHGGTAGGAAAGLHAFLQAKLVSGIDYFLQITGFEQAVRSADIVITGEGSIDEQTLQGKGPYGVAVRAKAEGLPVIGLAGRIPMQKSAALGEYFDMLLPIGNEPADLSTALRFTAANLSRTAGEIGNLLALCASK